MGAALQQGVQAATIGRQRRARAPACPVTVAGMTIDRQCSSGLMAIATAAKQMIVDGMQICVAGGVESISHGADGRKCGIGADPELVAMHKDVYMPMIETAEIVAAALRHQPRGAGRICAAVAAAHRRRARPRAASTTRSSPLPRR